VTARRFPPPWTVEDHNDACFIVKDRNRRALAYAYYEEEPGRRSAANLMTKDEAQRIAAISPSCPVGAAAGGRRQGKRETPSTGKSGSLFWPRSAAWRD
jgi:hypothetical protein